MSEDTIPTCPGDPRPNNEPWYIDSDCPKCGTALELHDPERGWNDEWECPKCQGGIHMDWPHAEFDELERRAEATEFIPLDEI